jgi:uncharacterized protein
MGNYLYDAVNSDLIEISPKIFDLLEQGLFTGECEKFLKGSLCRNIDNPVKFNFRHYYTYDEFQWLVNNRISSLTLALTEQCNLRCKYCGYMSKYTNQEYKLKEMPRNIAFKAIDLLATNSHESDLLHLGFYGGEPLLKFNLIKECVEYWKENYPFRMPIFYITTNAMLLGNEEISTYLIDHNFHLTISLDGSKEIHDKFRLDKSDSPSFNKVFENVVKFYKKDPKFFKTHVIFNSVVTSVTGNKKQYDYLAKLCKSNVMLIDVSPTKFFLEFLKKEKTEKPFRFNPEQYFFVYQSVLNDAVKFHKALLNNEYALDIFPGGFCTPGIRKNFVMPSGKIIICERVNEKEEVFCLGNVFEGLDVKKIRKLLKKTLEKTQKCKSCWAAKFCQLCFKDIFDLTDDFCIKAQNQVEQNLIYYLEKIRPNKELVNYLENLSIN